MPWLEAVTGGRSRQGSSAVVYFTKALLEEVVMKLTACEP